MKQNTKNSNTNIGLVVAYYGTSVAVGLTCGQIVQCQLRRNQALPVVGDQVYYQITHGHTGTVTEIMPRKNLLVRGGKGGSRQPLAANLDRLFIVMTYQGFSQYLLDRYVLAAELLGITPVIVINKIDIVQPEDRKKLSLLMSYYEKIPYEVVWISALTGEGVNQFKQSLQNQTAVFVGPSGVGKSSIIASMTHDNVAVGEVSSKGAGRHTTTGTRLYRLGNEGKLIDSPGVRDFSLWSVTKQEVLKGFKEFHAFFNQCKFRDCAHLNEPHCAIKKAVEDGIIHQMRYESYQKLMTTC